MITHRRTDLSLPRRSLLLGSLAAGAGLLAACGQDGSTPTASTPAGGGQTGWTPVTVPHKFGETRIDKAPTTVVSAGLTEHDFLLALGVTPAAVTDWYGDQPFATWPWARGKLGDAKPTVLNTNDGLMFAEIAKLRPDLIVACNASLTQPDYDKLSKIAPTVAQTSLDNFEPWTETLKTVGLAVGKQTESNALQASVKKKFTDAAAANPAFRGAKAIFLQNAVYDGNLIAYQEGLSTEFLTDLGFVVPNDINPFAKDGAQAYIPVERISVLDAADVLIWGTEKDSDVAALQKVPGFSSLKAVKAGRSVYTGGELAGAIYFASPLSLPYVVDTLTPQLAKAMA